jgi:acetyl esterase
VLDDLNRGRIPLVQHGPWRWGLPHDPFSHASTARAVSAFTVKDAYVKAENHRVPIRRYQPETDDGAVPTPTLVWLHGGGFFRGSINQPEADAVARELAGRGLAVVTVDYRLAPFPLVGRMNARGRPRRVRFPLPVDDVLTVVQHEHENSPHGVLLGGASAGACLAAAAALRVLDVGSDLQLEGVVLAYGFFHARLPRNAEIQRRVRGRRRVTHAPRMLDAANRNYAGSRLALTERAAFAGGHDLRGFPATIMVDADRDAMRASGEKFAAELIDAGAKVERHVLPETQHAFLNRPQLPEFAIAIDQIASWALARRRGSGTGPRRLLTHSEHEGAQHFTLSVKGETPVQVPFVVDDVTLTGVQWEGKCACRDGLP